MNKKNEKCRNRPVMPLENKFTYPQQLKWRLPNYIFKISHPLLDERHWNIFDNNTMSDNIFTLQVYYCGKKITCRVSIPSERWNSDGMKKIDFVINRMLIALVWQKEPKEIDIGRSMHLSVNEFMKWIDKETNKIGQSFPVSSSWIDIY